MADAPLPPGWEMRISSEGRRYYVDRENQKTQWARPTEHPSLWKQFGAIVQPAGWCISQVSSSPPPCFVDGVMHRVSYQREHALFLLRDLAYTCVRGLQVHRVCLDGIFAPIPRPQVRNWLTASIADILVFAATSRDSASTTSDEFVAVNRRVLWRWMEEEAFEQPEVHTQYARADFYVGDDELAIYLGNDGSLSTFLTLDELKSVPGARLWRPGRLVVLPDPPSVVYPDELFLPEVGPTLAAMVLPAPIPAVAAEVPIPIVPLMARPSIQIVEVVPKEVVPKEVVPCVPPLVDLQPVVEVLPVVEVPMPSERIVLDAALRTLRDHLEPPLDLEIAKFVPKAFFTRAFAAALAALEKQLSSIDLFGPGEAVGEATDGAEEEIEREFISLRLEPLRKCLLDLADAAGKH